MCIEKTRKTSTASVYSWLWGIIVSVDAKLQTPPTDNVAKLQCIAFFVFSFLFSLQLCSRVAIVCVHGVYLCLCGAAFSRLTMKIAATMSLNFHAASSVIMYAPDRAFMIGLRKSKNRLASSTSPLVIIINHSPTQVQAPTGYY